MRVLIIGPLPRAGFTTGQAAAVQLFLDEVRKSDEVEVVDLTSRVGIRGFRFFRVFEAFQVALKVWYKSRTTDVIYFTISESILGNLKDILIYMACIGRLRNVVIHMHGGNGMRQLLKNRNSLVFRANRIFLSRIKKAIVLGESQRDLFAGCIDNAKVYAVPNFADSSLFLSEDAIVRKHHNQQETKVLFLSNLIEGKGHLELLDAYSKLDERYKERISIAFAGYLPEDDDSKSFLDKLSRFPRLRFLGPVFGDEKRTLFKESQIFCLPTYYAYEGQPISILEAYASGCAVITTYHSGIVDIFLDGVNGFVVETRSELSLRTALERCCEDTGKITHFGSVNNAIARNKFTTRTHLDLLMHVVKS
jgi:glycosyltransferase involved in cell wall biosynthesis